ncbi:trifunctional transcriptional regulator/proline dehydrogenase/L-glutamate gamma-semialdehyde dehydrogenase [uncultured Deefgea sp.]|uniref:trifunctional transcriptional regulator/proline dehydrogenase/L-glutamate gamma-semialdehyde dehydrogenase n=1 Tax=uncultured Deefgea sp. TaxID=1304914 RepID=UPI00260558E9|nr:trifunctional transcriptional regulator/proline dehydrogenase/L-glutamate gamma-semialdehyde dehydrogenase [uncultured Deefgea sp.]
MTGSSSMATDRTVKLVQLAQRLDISPDFVLQTVGSAWSVRHENEYPLAPLSNLNVLPRAVFSGFIGSLQVQSPLRRAITAAYRLSEAQCLPRLIAQAVATPQQALQIQALGQKLVTALRAKGSGNGVESLIHEFSLSSQEGVALMCLAEALLRIPDTATRDVLIRDKLSGGDWQSHLGQSSSLFVNAASWGLMLTGKLVSLKSEASLAQSLTRLIAQGSEPLIRKAMDSAMRMMGGQFVCGETIAAALKISRTAQARGFRYSYDMLGEAATTADDAQRYYAAYEAAIHAIGNASAGRGVYDGPGISIKLSALHPRYSRAQLDCVRAELLPRLIQLACLACQYDIGLNIDAEEADRLDISLDLLEALCFEPRLAAWKGIGFVIQAYQKRAPWVIDFVIDLAQRSGHRLMVRLVKGAYWDSEIKRAQVDGLVDYPVYTRKIYTDVAYLACAKQLLAAPEAIYPQFATHNAQTLASIYHFAGADYQPDQYEFQCLHGMGESLYDEVVGAHQLARPCRIYAPVGSHETLLAYLVRRLLENGANSSFVNQIADEGISITDLLADPVCAAKSIHPLYSSHDRIALPSKMFGKERQNSRGLDLSNESELHQLALSLLASTLSEWHAEPILAETVLNDMTMRLPVLNPADHRDVVGYALEATEEHVEQAFGWALAQSRQYAHFSVAERVACLQRAADLLETRMPILLGLIVREAGKSLPNAIAEVREAVDFLRYYAAQIDCNFSATTHRGLGIVVCISPWNFPLAIFMGQIAAALAAGNLVLAKPAEQTPLIAAEAVRILHEAGIPRAALQFLLGSGETVGAALIRDPRCSAVMFTGSTAVAQLIAQSLALRLDVNGKSIPLIAETGGQNCMIVDSSAQLEQVVADVLLSAFDSAGQRCSALRVVCVQVDIAERFTQMLKGAMQELRVGRPDTLSVDVGPVIDAEAQRNIEQHIHAFVALGTKVTQLPLPKGCQQGSFVAPTLIEIEQLSQLKHEVFGPVLHLLTYHRDDLPSLLRQINHTGYGLTFGVHSRIDETIDQVVSQVQAGNVYVNRNVVGAVVGVQPFGGEGLSGTGPKAGGPLYLQRLLSKSVAVTLLGNVDAIAALNQYRDSLLKNHHASAASRCGRYLQPFVVASYLELPGPTGELNQYLMHPRGLVWCICETLLGAQAQWAAVLLTGNRAVLSATDAAYALRASLSESMQENILILDAESIESRSFAAVLFEGEHEALRALNQALAQRKGPIVQAQGLSSAALASDKDYDLSRLLAERSISVNTAAAGGNACLMTSI